MKKRIRSETSPDPRPACTIKLVPLGNKGESPVLGTLEAIVAGNAGDVLVIDHGGRMDVNSYGGVAGFTTKHRGLVGCVMDGVTRDIDEFKMLDLPVYGKGAIQQSIRNRCVFAGLNVEVQLGGVRVRPGDLIMADENGVVVVPKSISKKCSASAPSVRRSRTASFSRSRTAATPSRRTRRCATT
jgi:regulator of RNase E activity RraA